MKMVCKKLLSLVLVALMLVSAVPFQASAAGSVEVPVTVYINDEAVNTSKTLTVDDSGVVLDESLAMTMLKNTENRKFVKWMNNSNEDVTGNSLDSDWVDSNPGYSLSLYLSETKPTEPDPTEHVHNYSVEKERVEPTCGKDGYVVKKCDGCDSEVKEILSATGNHTWDDGEILVEATATTEGTKLYTCKVCGATKKESYGANVKEIVFQVTVNGSTTSTTKGFVINKTMELPTPSVPAGYKFKGWFSESNGKGTQLANGTTCTENLANVYYAYFTEDVKFDYNVYLNIYTDNKVDEPAKRITITNGIAKDGKVTLAEVKDVVFDYYTAKDSNGITFDGLYMATGNWVDKFNKNDKFDTVDTSDLKEQNNVFVNVMITNAKAKSSSSSSSSSSNPKTGDTIYMAVTVMGLSAASLAAVYYISKKRAVR